MSASIWIHCNKCCARYNKNQKFFLTDCGHLNCEPCIKKMQENGKKCLICGYNCAFIQLSNDIKPDIQLFFTNPADAIDKLKNQINFQHTNYQHLLKVTTSKYLCAKNQITKLNNLVVELKQENKYLRRNSGRTENFTPCIGNGRKGPILTSTQISGTYPPSIGTPLSSVRSAETKRLQPSSNAGELRPNHYINVSGKHLANLQMRTPTSSYHSPAQMVPPSAHSRNSSHSRTSAMSSLEKLRQSSQFRQSPQFRQSSQFRR